MLSDKEARLLLIQYPDGLSKEVFRKVCHVSPRTATFLLESGRVPCKIRPQRTHKYLISTTDMILYLRDREKHPEKYAVSIRSRNRNQRHKPSCERPSESLLALLTDNDYELACKEAVEDCQDVLSVQQVIGVIGYSYKRIMKWCSDKQLFSIKVNRAILVPKLSLYEFMLSKTFRNVKLRSEKHWKLLNSAVAFHQMNEIQKLEEKE